MNYSLWPSAALLLTLLGTAQAQSAGMPIMAQPPQWQAPEAPISSAPPYQAPPLVMPPAIEVTPGSLTPPAPSAPLTPEQSAALPLPANQLSIGQVPTGQISTGQVAPIQVNPGSLTPSPLSPAQSALPTVTAPTFTAPAQPSFTFHATPTLQTTSSVSLTPLVSPETILLWGGTAVTRAAAGLSFGASYPVLQVNSFRVLARGTGEVGLVASDNTGTSLLMLRADALASYPLGDNAVYGGPGIVAGHLHGLGVTLGYRAQLSTQLGAFIEGQLNRYWSSGTGRAAPGLRTGLTYRF